MKFTATTDTAAWAAEMERQRIALRQAQRFTVDRLAFIGLDAVKAEVDRVFDRPTPYVRNGFRVIKVGQTVTSSAATRKEDNAAAVAIIAGAGEIFADVEYKEGNDVSAGQGGGAIPTRKILAAQVAGGTRRFKRFEIALQRVGALPAGLMVVPARGARLDQYGNITGARITAILSDLRAFQETGFKANRAEGVRGRFFVIRQKSASHPFAPGIYERRKRGNPVMIMAFVKPPTYRPRFDPVRVSREAIAAQHDAVWAEEFTRALGRLAKV
jgi:hypothetical protein